MKMASFFGGFTDDHWKIFAEVVWYAEHPNKLHYGRPLEIWKREFICDGPAFFLPLHKISCL